MRRLLVTTVLAVALAVPALAATPEKGEGSKANVQAKWSGETTNGAATTITAIIAGRTAVCEQPSCDTYTLTVKGSDLLTSAATGTAFTMVEVVTPAGE